ncbi:MAG TPA: hypothetical protein VEQ40_02425 [Pyrinomonadaceae bacterium]|nr:hypothetical protein [Pyrinomonadaceae bacterium]
MKTGLLLIVLFIAITTAGLGNGWSLQALTSAARASSQASTGVEFDSGRWQINNPKAKVEERLGRKSLHLPNGFAFLKDVVLENGVIEVDIAAPNLRSFVGIVFRFENEDEHEIVYFRPHKSGLEDAVQYTPSFNGSACWQLYSGKGFTTAVDFPREQWVHARIEVSGLGAKVYLNNSEKPTLVVEDLKRGHSRGTIGLWSGANGGHFSNFTYKVEPVGQRVERKRMPLAAGILSKWELSEAFDVAQRDPETLPSASAMTAMKWQEVGVEPPGMVVIDRYRRSPSIVRFFAEPSERVGKREGRKVVFARATVYSESEQVKKMSLGYSDEVTVFLNSRPVFTGRSAFRFRDPGFLGIMDVENDSVYLDLKKGRNEIILALADYFGGWGFICRIDDMRGVKLE